MPQGLSADVLVISWQWLPVPPWPLERPLPPRRFRDDAAFRSGDLPAGEMDAFRFSFPQLARQTPDLHFYRLIQLFNTPLRSLTTRDAAHAGFAHWRGEMPRFREDFRWAHLWFFDDRTDGDTVVVEYGYEGGLTLWSDRKPEAELAARHAKISALVNAAAPELGA